MEKTPLVKKTRKKERPPFSVRLPQDLEKELRNIAHERNTTASAVFREAIRWWLGMHK